MLYRKLKPDVHLTRTLASSNNKNCKKVYFKSDDAKNNLAFCTFQ